MTRMPQELTPEQQQRRERFARVAEIFHRAAALSGPQRIAYLAEACAGDRALRREVESLLAQPEADSDELESPVRQAVAAAAAEMASGNSDDMLIAPGESAGQRAGEDSAAMPPDGAPRGDSLAGRHVGPYRVLARIGVGGMGEVYRAHDAQLGRDVAIKVLPRAYSSVPERLARFRREARTLASLNHPNIAAIYGLEESSGTPMLIMEMVPGETLAERLRRGPIPLREALTIAAQVADGLAAAHRKGITHRDIKPANVKVTDEHRVKLLDFGLAKFFADESVQPLSPDTLLSGTADGHILGTPAYMSPEQARGKPADKQCDIWAFGCLLYEMLSGQRAFRGKTVTDTIAAVLESEPDWDGLPGGAPASLRSLLAHCLSKDVTSRLHDISDARIAIDDLRGGAHPDAPAAEMPAARHAAGGWRIPWPALALLVLLVGSGTYYYASRDAAPGPRRSAAAISRFTYTLPPTEHLTMLAGSAISIAPDGSQFTYVASTEGARSQLFVRSIDSLEARPLVGTEGADTPFYSADGNWIGFWSGRLQRISTHGGSPVPISRWENTNGGASWDHSGNILYALSNRSALYRVPAEGGTPEAVTKLEHDNASHRWPVMLPGGRAILYVSWNGTADNSQIIARRLETGEQKVLIQGGTFPRYVPTGHLVFAKGGNLLAAPFDAQRLELLDTPVVAVESVMQSIQGAAQFSFSDNGTLVYVPGGMWVDPGYLALVDRQGNEEVLRAPPRPYLQVDLSPDGRKAALLIQQGKMNIWVYDLPSNQLRQLTEDGTQTSPLWSIDGSRIAFGKTVSGRRNLYWRPADGSGALEQLTSTEFFHQPGSFSPLNVLAYGEVRGTNRDIYVAAMNGDRRSRVWLDGPSDESVATFSPDGRNIAYVSNLTGKFEIYVQAYAGPGERRQISRGGGEQPLWSADGRELFYRNGDDTMVAEVLSAEPFRASAPRLLFRGRYKKQPGPGTNFGVMPDGRKFLFIKPGDLEPSATQINVVLNWFEELRQKVPVQ